MFRLQAARQGSLETVEWLLSDAPIRCYNDFAEANPTDERIKSLSETPGGFEACVRNFLDVRSHLIIHCCVMGKPTSQSLNLLRYLVKTLPDCIDARSQELMTPFLVAFRTHRMEAAKILIEAGADQTARDKNSSNIIHHLLQHQMTKEDQLGNISAMLDLVDKRLLPDLFLERSATAPGALTPLAQFVHQAKHSSHYYRRPAAGLNDKVLKLILQYSKGAELNSINGEGHTPLHVVVREKDESLTGIILEQDPTLLLRENATGRTPFEMAEDSRIAAIVANPPNIRTRQTVYSERAHRRHQDQSICQIPSKEFVEDPERDFRGGKEKIWDLVQKVKGRLVAEGRAKRKLVTLNEANEVAKRLAARKMEIRKRMGTGRGRGGRFRPVDDEIGFEIVEEEREERDEVEMWMPV